MARRSRGMLAFRMGGPATPTSEPCAVPPPPPGSPPSASWSSGTRAPSRRIPRGPVILAGVAVIVAVIVVLAMTGRGGAQFPDQVGGYARLTTPQATQIEDFISNTSVAGVHMRGAVYGSGAGPTFVVVVITGGLPPGSSLDSILGRLPNGGG